ncbi:hypothetical protein BDV12DRAFT_196353 [Aspergillus spectabilis]
MTELAARKSTTKTIITTIQIICDRLWRNIRFGVSEPKQPPNSPGLWEDCDGNLEGQASLSHARTRTKLRRWFSSHLISPAHTDPNNHNDYTTNYKSSNPETDKTDLSHPSSSSLATRVRITPDLPAATIPNLNPNFNYDDDSDYDSASPHHIFTNTHRPTYQTERELQRHHRHLQQQQQQSEIEEQDLTLTDNYAAYCREFTSFPPLDPNQSPVPRKPLPFLPSSESWAENPESEGSMGPNYISASALTSALGRGPAQSSSQIRFLPVGAHGYHPASWALPRPPSPPLGILTPDRYEVIQRRQVEEDQEMKEKKDKQRRGWLTWCMPIRASSWPWGRAKRPERKSLA